MTNNRRPPAATAPRLGWVLGLTSTAYFMVVLDAPADGQLDRAGTRAR